MNCGIYLVRGDIGSGKSKMLRELLYDGGGVSFRQYACVPQNVPCTAQKVWDYVAGGQDIDRERFLRLLTDFGLVGNKESGGIDFRTRVDRLSGGERSVLCIISALLKDVPCLVMDEPTNNLDDHSVETLLGEILPYSREHTVVLVTHDPRVISILDTCDNVYMIDAADGKSLEEELAGSADREAPENRTPENSRLRFAIAHMAGEFTVDRLNLASSAAALVSMFVVLMVNVLIGVNYYAVKDESVKNHILVYLVDNSYGQVNREYARTEKLSVNPDISRRVKFSDMERIAGMEGVREIYILHEKMYERLYNALDGNCKDEPVEISIPLAMLKGYASCTGLSEAFVLRAGRPPADGSREIALPLSLARVLTDAGKVVREEEDGKIYETGNLIGQRVSLEDGEYTISGITPEGIYWYPFVRGDDRLFYTYRKSTFPEFERETERYRQDYELGNEDHLDNIFLVTESGKERKVLNGLVSEFPADNYYCGQIEKIYSSSLNRPMLLRLTVLDLAAAVFAALLSFFISRNRWREDTALTEHFENFYFDRAKIRRLYLFCHGVSDIIPGAVSIAIGIALLSEFPGMGKIYGCCAAFEILLCLGVTSIHAVRDMRSLK